MSSSNISIDKSKLKKTFLDLIEINSLYPNDIRAQQYVHGRLLGAGLTCELDKFGNVFARIKGDPRKPAIMLNTHFDIPEDTPKVYYEEKGDLITGTGRTILGADAKTGVAILLELAEIISINRSSGMTPVDFVFTRGEENALSGARNLDYSKLRAKEGFVIDQDGPVSEVVIQAPGWIKLNGSFHGKIAHTREPENAINALTIASKAFLEVPFGHSDKSKRVTWNVGIVSGGTAVNSIPGIVKFKSELRSFDKKLLVSESERIKNTFTKIASQAGGNFKSESEIMSQTYMVSDDNPLLVKYIKTLEKYNLKPKKLKTFGASDANIFNQNGMNTIAIGSGYYNAHQYNEQANLKDMQQIAEFLYDFISD